MRLTIEIPKQIYQNAKDDMLCGSEIIVNAIKKGTPIEQEDYISRKQAIRLFEQRFIELQKVHQQDMQLGVNWCINTIKDMPSVTPTQNWIPLKWEIEGISCDIPEELDGNWLLFTNGKCDSIERIKKDAQDHFYPDGRCFELEDAVAWMPLPESYKTESEVEDGNNNN